MEDKLEFKKDVIMENNGNKLILLEGCDLIDGVSRDKLVELFPEFTTNISNLMNCYIIELSNGDILYE